MDDRLSTSPMNWFFSLIFLRLSENYDFHFNMRVYVEIVSFQPLLLALYFWPLVGSVARIILPANDAPFPATMSGTRFTSVRNAPTFQFIRGIWCLETHMDAHIFPDI